MTINDIKIGDNAIITKITLSSSLRIRFLDMGFLPNTKIKVQKIAPFGDPIQIRLRGYDLIIKKEYAEKIQVKKVGC